MGSSTFYVLLVAGILFGCARAIPVSDVSQNSVEHSAEASPNTVVTNDPAAENDVDADYDEESTGATKSMFSVMRETNKVVGKPRRKGIKVSKFVETDIMPRPAAPTDVMNYDVIKNKALRWEMPIHYAFHRKLSNSAKQAFKDSVAEIESKTKNCITFKEEKTNYKQKMLYIVAAGGCWSYIGDVKSMKKQKLSLSWGCHYKSIAVHEIFHALGFEHEQSRHDRDDYIKIIWDNVMQGYKSQYNKAKNSSFDSYGVDYDYTSVMHYDKYGFTKNGEPTIAYADSVNTTGLPTEFGQELDGGMTDLDLEQLNLLYCNDTTPEPPTTAASTTAFPPPTDHPSMNCTGQAPKSYNGVCEDQVSFCKTMADEGWCDNCWVQNKCLQTCSGPDKIDNCDWLKRKRNACEEGSTIFERKEMDVNCRATCGLNKC